jgi:hypothetical protein
MTVKMTATCSPFYFAVNVMTAGQGNGGLKISLLTSSEVEQGRWKASIAKKDLGSSAVVRLHLREWTGSVTDHGPIRYSIEIRDCEVSRQNCPTLSRKKIKNIFLLRDVTSPSLTHQLPTGLFIGGFLFLFTCYVGLTNMNFISGNATNKSCKS